jgi:hypothetical protein
MKFTKTQNIYKILCLTGSQNNILGVSFSQKNEKTKIQVVEWPIEKNKKIETSKKRSFKLLL